MSKFHKKPVVIEAFEFRVTMTNADAPKGFETSVCRCDEGRGAYPRSDSQHVHTMEGPLHISDGDWVIKGVQGEFYPVKPDIFEATYEAVMKWPVREGKMTDERLKEIQERLDKATPGPWEARTWHEESGMTAIFPVRGSGSIADVSHWKDGSHCAANKQDADFIAHSISDIPFLLAELQRYKDVVARAAEAFDHAKEVWSWTLAKNAFSILETLKEE